MTEGRVSREQRLHYKLDQVTPVNRYEMNTYNVPFAGNTSTCRETFVKGERVLEFSIAADMSLDQMLNKPMFRDELIEYMYSFSKQLVSIVQNGLNINKVVFDRRFLYARMSDFTIQILYLPLDKEFAEADIAEFIKTLLSKIIYAHTPAIECANQIIESIDEYKDFDVYRFNKTIKEMRRTSQLLIIREEAEPYTGSEAEKYAIEESSRLKAEEAARTADRARLMAENEAKRQTEYARKQAELARQAEEARIQAEAARVQIEIERQRAENEAILQGQTAVLYQQQQESGQNSEEIMQARLMAEAAKAQAEEDRRRAEAEANKLADEIRLAKEAEKAAEAERIRAEYEARKMNEEAKIRAEEARRKTEEANRFAEARNITYQTQVQKTISQTSRTAGAYSYYKDSMYVNNMADDMDPATTVLSGRNIRDEKNAGMPRLIRQSNNEEIIINKQVFCIGKADQGVDYKITGNKSISRRHAYITTINGVNYLRDNNSTNHTYINGKQVYSNIDVVIPDKSIIKFSNEEFLFRTN